MKILFFGELMMRLSPPHTKRILQSDSLEITFGGSEANVAIALSLFHEQTEFLSALPSNALGEAALAFLRKYGVEVEHIARKPARLGLYFFERGASQRADRVLYDREASAFNFLSETDFDFEEIFKGADWLHLSGISLSLSPAARKLSLTLVREAKKRGLTVSFDPNFREKLSSKEDYSLFQTIASESDVILASGNGLSCLGVEPLEMDEEKFLSAANYLTKRYSLSALFCSMRKQFSAENHLFRGFAYLKEPAFSKSYSLRVIDRIGGGDAFAAGAIYALRQKMNAQEAVEFATAAGALKHSIEGDQLLCSKEEVFSVLSDESGRILR